MSIFAETSIKISDFNLMNRLSFVFSDSSLSGLLSVCYFPNKPLRRGWPRPKREGAIRQT
jgi:hypothetical protein